MTRRLIKLTVASLMVCGASACNTDRDDQYGKYKDGPYDSYSNDAPGVERGSSEVYTSDPGYHYHGEQVDSPQADMRK